MFSRAVLASCAIANALPRIITARSIGNAQSKYAPSRRTRMFGLTGKERWAAGPRRDINRAAGPIEEIPDEEHDAEEHPDREPTTELHRPDLAPKQTLHAQVRAEQAPRCQQHQENLGGEHRVAEKPGELVLAPESGRAKVLERAAHAIPQSVSSADRMAVESLTALYARQPLDRASKFVVPYFAFASACIIPKTFPSVSFM